jgi:hypothetical protein
MSIEDPAHAGRQLILHRLQLLAHDKSASLKTLRHLARDIADPTLDVVLDLLSRDVEQESLLMRRLVNGAFDALTCQSGRPAFWHGAQPEGRATDVEALTAEMRVLRSHEQRSARELRDLVSCEHELGDDGICLLLDSMASDSDKHAHLLDLLAQRMETVGAKAHPAG